MSGDEMAMRFIIVFILCAASFALGFCNGRLSERDRKRHISIIEGCEVDDDENK